MDADELQPLRVGQCVDTNVVLVYHFNQREYMIYHANTEPRTTLRNAHGGAGICLHGLQGSGVNVQ